MAQTVYGNPFIAQFEAHTNAGCVDSQVFIAPFACQVVSVAYDHAVAGNDAGAVNLQLTKLTGTTALASGTALLTNNTNAGFDCKATAQTRQTGTLTATTASLQLAAGDKLCADFTGVVTTLSGVVMTVVLKSI
jgi:hypothetical protein